MITNIYLNFPGNCAEALSYYEQHLGAKTTSKLTFEQMPPKNMPPGMKITDVLHARFKVGDAELMASDGPADHVQPMRSAYVAIRVDSTPRLSASTKSSPTEAKSSCRWKKLSSRIVLASCATSSASTG